MTNPAVTIDAVTKRYGSQTALDDVSAAIAPGETLALLGHNGAGKTTLIKLILGLTRPQKGRIDVLGHTPGSDIMRRQCAYLPENVAFHKSLTGREQLTLFSRLKGGSASRIADHLDRVGLGEAMDRRIGTYSKGMRQRLGLAQILIGEPRIVILDEPTNGLDPLSRDMFYAMISGLAGAGAAVLLSSHALTELEARTDRIVILRQGRVAANGRLSQLRAGAHLPIRVRVEAAADMATEVARRFGGTRINGRSVELVCEASEKIQRISEVTALGPAVEDIDIVPPSLEDVYRHYSRPAAAQEDK
jgi:Cu-processing system ATP-binding protein